MPDDVFIADLASKAGFFRVDRPGLVAFKPFRDGGMLLLFDERRIELFMNQPSAPPWVAEKTPRVPKWRRSYGTPHCNVARMIGAVELAHARRQGKRVRGRLPPRPTVAAYERFLETFDPKHLAVLRRFPHQDFVLYNAIRRCPGLLELLAEESDVPELAGGAAVGYALAHLRWLREPHPTRPLRMARGLLRRKRRETAVVLGVPREAAAIAVRALGRMPLRELAVHPISLLLGALRRADARTLKLFAHAERIGMTSLDLLASRDLAPHLTASLLHEASEQRPGVRYDQTVPLLLRDTVAMVERRGGTMPTLRSVVALRAAHDAEVERAAREHRLGPARPARWPDLAGPLPEAPVRELPGAIEYVGTHEALTEEGATMMHCVAGYGLRVARGECFIYRVLEPERATVAIALRADGRFHLDQLSGPRNQRVDPATTRSVERWLREGHDPRVAERVRALQRQISSAPVARAPWRRA